MSIPNIGYAHRSATSAAAATSMEPHVLHLRDRVIKTLQAFPDGLTADEVATLLDLTVLSVRPRVTELAKAGKIRTAYDRTLASIRRPNVSGRAANVWVVV